MEERAVLVWPTKALGFTVRLVLDWQRYTALADHLQSTVAASIE